MSYINNKPYYMCVNALCTVVTEQLDSALWQVMHLNFASFCLRKCTMQEITLPAVGLEPHRGWLETIMPQYICQFW